MPSVAGYDTTAAAIPSRLLLDAASSLGHQRSDVAKIVDVIRENVLGRPGKRVHRSVDGFVRIEKPKLP
jgi:hypothetical protein